MWFRRKVTDKKLMYSATERCICGAGLAYTKHMDYWDCSDIIKRDPEADNYAHSDPVPFSERFIKSEVQLSAGGETTRPRTTEQIMQALAEFKKRTEDNK